MQKANPEGLAKCLFLLVGAAGFELVTPCTHMLSHEVVNLVLPLLPKHDTLLEVYVLEGAVTA